MGDPIAMVDGSIGIWFKVASSALVYIKIKPLPPLDPHPPGPRSVAPRRPPRASIRSIPTDAESPVRFRFVARQRCGAPAKRLPAFHREFACEHTAYTVPKHNGREKTRVKTAST